MHTLERVNVFVNKILMVLGSVAVLLLMADCNNECLLESPFIKSTWRGAYETVWVLGAIVIAFALGYTQKEKIISLSTS